MKMKIMVVLGLLFSSIAVVAVDQAEICEYVMQTMINEASAIGTELYDSVMSINNTSNTLAGLVNTLAQGSANNVNTLSSQLVALNAQLDAGAQGTAQTLALVQQNGALINQMMQEMTAQQQAAAVALDTISQELSNGDDTTLLNAIEAVDGHVGVLCAVVEAGGCCLNAKMNALSSQLAECCTELSENDATILNAVASVDMHLDDVETTVIIGDMILNANMNALSNQLADCCTELSEDDAKIFSAVESVDAHLGNVQTTVIVGDMILNANMNALANQLADCCTELSEDDAKIFSAIESVDGHVGNVATTVIVGDMILNANMNALSNQLADCCTELSEDDAKIFSAVESVDAHLGNVQTTVIVGDMILNANINALSNQLADCCTELSEDDAKIFSAVERIENTLDAVFCAANREREAEIIESPVSRNQVRFIKNKQLTRAGGIVITEPGLYMLTESLTIDGQSGITIQADNVTFDLNKFTITTTSDDVTPLTIAQADTVCAKNGTFVGGQGIALTGASGVSLENLVVTYPTSAGIQMSNVQCVTLDNCTVRNGAQAGITADTGSTEITIRDTTASDCQGNGFDLQAQGLLIQNSIAHYNGGIGVNISNSANAHLQRLVVDNNSNNGIFVDSSVDRVQVESCRVMGNGAIGCVDNGATLATWMNNLASGNAQDDYQNIKAVLVGKATSFWHNVYGN